MLSTYSKQRQADMTDSLCQCVCQSVSQWLRNYRTTMEFHVLNNVEHTMAAEKQNFGSEFGKIVWHRVLRVLALSGWVQIPLGCWINTRWGWLCLSSFRGRQGDCFGSTNALLRVCSQWMDGMDGWMGQRNCFHLSVWHQTKLEIIQNRKHSVFRDITKGTNKRHE